MPYDIHPQFQPLMDHAIFMRKYITVVGSLFCFGLILFHAFDVPARLAHTPPHGPHLWPILPLLLFWAALMAAGHYLVQFGAAWLRRATAIYQRNPPVPMLRNTSTVADYNRDRIDDLAHLQPLTSPSPLPALSNIPLSVVRWKFQKRYPEIVDAHANVYVDGDPTGPIVIEAGDQLWCSSRGYNRLTGTAWYFQPPHSWPFLRRRISRRDS